MQAQNDKAKAKSSTLLYILNLWQTYGATAYCMEFIIYLLTYTLNQSLIFILHSYASALPILSTQLHVRHMSLINNGSDLTCLSRSDICGVHSKLYLLLQHSLTCSPSSGALITNPVTIISDTEIGFWQHIASQHITISIQRTVTILEFTTLTVKHLLFFVLFFSFKTTLVSCQLRCTNMIRMVYFSV